MIDQDVERLTPVLQPPAEWGFGDALPADTFAGLSEDAMLSELEKHERLTAWLAGRGVALTEALTRSREKSALERLDAEQPDASARARNLVKAEVRACIDHEVELATGLPSSVARTRTKIAIGDPVRFGPVRQALSRGELSWQRAWHLVRATEEAPAEAIEKIVASVIAPYPARSADGLGGLLVPQSVFTSRLRYQLAKVTTPRERHEQGVENRCTMTMLDPDRGTGEVRITGHAGRVAGAHERVDAIARRLRKEGDRRTLAQLRSDIALDLMLFGQLPRQGDLLDPHTGQQRQEDPAAVDAALAAYGTFDGELPPARVDVVIP
ncbi:MAG: hypothetical protein Q4G43_16170, partial [Mobilicoccus sp.]|nr:hypothetical protein [Mobilicoccus sp.]